MTMTQQERHPGPGRPRGFDLDAAIEAGVQLFRRQGFEATSLDALTETMGISRSSFYAAFGSKHGVLMTALERYSAQRLAALESVAASAGPRPAAALLRAISDPAGGGHGCLLVNCVSELSPRDPEVAALGARHLDRIEGIFARSLSPAAPAAAADRARALTALALGALTLRKAGHSPEAIAAVLALAEPLISTPT